MSIAILCVDDDPNILESYRRLFSRRYDVYLALGPTQGLEKLELGPRYAVILSDKHMPDMDGVEFLHRASARFPKSYRVMLTGDADVETAIDAVNRGNIQRYLQKPCPSSVLEKIVDEAVALAQLQDQGESASQAKAVYLQQLSQLLAWQQPEEFQRCEKASLRASEAAGQRGQELPEVALFALRLATVGALAPHFDLEQRVRAGAELLALVPGWGEVVDLQLQIHGFRAPSVLGSLLKAAFESEGGHPQATPGMEKVAG